MKTGDLRSPRYWGGKLIEITVAAAVALGLILYMEARHEAERQQVTAEDWFVVNDIYVPDHEAGSNPIMLYGREILEPHRGFWVVEAQRQVVPGEARFFNECSGSGVANYDKSDTIPEDEVTWEWFFDRPCAVPPGIYRIEMTKDMSVEGYPVKSMRPKYSNTFRVYAPGTMPRPDR